MYVYFNLCLLLIFLALLNIYLQKHLPISQRIAIEIFIIMLFSLVMAFRPVEVPDTESYIHIFNNSESLIQSIYNINLFTKYNSVEYGFIVLSSLFKHFFNSYKFMFFVIAFLTVYFIPINLTRLIYEDDLTKNMKSKQNKKTLYVTIDPLLKHTSFIRSCYIASFGILYSGIAIRGGLALLLGTRAIYYVKRKKNIKAFIILLIGFTLQRSIIFYAFAAVLFILFQNKSTMGSNRAFFFITVLEMFVVVANQRSNLSKIVYTGFYWILEKIHLTNYYYSFIDSSNSVNLGLTKFILCTCITLILFSIYKRRIYLSKYFNLMLVIALTIIVAFVGARAVSRVYDLALVFSLPILSKIKDELEEKRSMLLSVTLIIVLTSFIFISLKTCFVDVFSII